MDGIRATTFNHRRPSRSTLLVLLIFSVWSCTLVREAYSQTYTLSDGDVVTCIPIADQTSLKSSVNPKYNTHPTTTINIGTSIQFPDRALLGQQTFAREVPQGCPNGTIPVTSENGGAGTETVKRLKYWRPQENSAAYEAPDDHQYAIAAVESSNVTNPAYKGTEVVMNIWDPYVEDKSEFSLAQLWITKTQANGLLNTVEAGYQVYPEIDNLSRLFVYWTADSYSNTGCYDLDCEGFIQVSNKILIRGSFKPTSSEQDLYEIKMQVFQDDSTFDWWLRLNDEVVGYWPSDIYPVDGLGGPADDINWGGEIVNNETADGNRHTSTVMGSGKAATTGYDQAAYMRNLLYVDSSNNLVKAPISLFNTSAPCYSVALGNGTPEWGSYFYFGGPGYGPNCQ